MPRRVQRTRVKGERGIPEGAVYVGRPGPFGNPFKFHTRAALARVPALDGSAWEYEDRISGPNTRHDYHWPDGHVTEHYVRWMTRAETVETYRRALTNPTPALRLYHRSRSWTRGRDGQPLGYVVTVDLVREQLAGKDLACWCDLGDPCHADVLLEVANS